MGGLAGGTQGGVRSKPGERINFGEIRAAFLRNGADPRAWETMTLLEMEGMMRSFSKQGQDTEIDMEAAKDKWRGLGLKDVKV